MKFGTISGPINGTETLVGYTKLTTSASTITISGLAGDTDDFYTILVKQVYATSDSTLNMLLNNDSTATNYGNRGITSVSSTTSNINSTATTIRLCAVTNAAPLGCSFLKFIAKSNRVRLLNGMNVTSISASTITGLELVSSVYAVTNTTITSLVFQPTAGHLGAGTTVAVLKSNNNTGGTPTGAINSPYIQGSWVRVGSSVLAATTSTITFSGLNGDADIIYYLSCYYSSAGAGGPQNQITINADSGPSYGTQRLRSSNVTVTSVRAISQSAYFGYGVATNNFTAEHSVLFAESTFVRPIIMWSVGDVTTGATVTAIQQNGWAYKDTTANITSLKFTCSSGNFTIGSQFDLYALRPNG